MTNRLPTVGADSGAWGTVLNAFLGMAHNADGTLKNLFVNLGDFCAIDGSTDDSTGFTTAYALASSSGRALWHPGGTLVKGNDTILPNVTILGPGPGLATIKLKNGANTDLFSAQTASIALSATYGTGIQGTLFNFSFQNITLDGNKANQSSGTSWVLRFYGFGYILHNVRIKNGYSGGMLSDWNGGNVASIDNMEAHLSNVKIHDCNGVVLQMGGPHDSSFVNCDFFNAGSHVMHVAPNAVALKFTTCHWYGPGFGNNSAGVLSEAQTVGFDNCICEDSDIVNVVLLGSSSVWVGGNIFAIGTGQATATGMKLGQQASETPYAGQILQAAGVTTAQAPSNCTISTTFFGHLGTHGTMWLDNDGGNNSIQFLTTQASGSVITGTYAASSQVSTNVRGLTADGTLAKGGTSQVAGKANSAFHVSDGTNDVFNVNTYGKRLDAVNNTEIRGWTDLYTTTAFQLNSDGNGSGFFHGAFSVGQSATSPDPGAGGTINTAGIGSARVTPAASRAGVILQAGTQPGQKCTVLNNSGSFTITFAASGTSHVAQGIALVIAVNAKYDFTWDSGAALWY